MKIRFLAEVLRYKEGFSINQGWLESIFSCTVERATQHSIDSISKRELRYLQSEVFKCYNIAGFANDTWLSLYNLSPNDRLLDVINGLFSESLVICFELHPLIQKSFDALHIPYLKLIWHPVRYLDDIFFGMSSNVPAIYEKLLRYKASEFLFRQYAGILKAETYLNEFGRGLRIHENSCVFFGQSNVDCSLIDGNRILNFFNFKDKFMEDIKQYDHVYYKIHPCDGKNDEVIRFIRSVKHAEVLSPHDIDFYDLISSDNIKKCFAISSGSLYEARLFGKDVKYYYKQPFMFVDDYQCKAYDMANTFIPVYKSFWQPSFWADILSVYFSVETDTPYIEEHYSNRLRRILRLSWGYYDCSSVCMREHLTELHERVRRIEKVHLTELHARRRCIEGENRTLKCKTKHRVHNFFIRLVASLLPSKHGRKMFRNKYLK